MQIHPHTIKVTKHQYDINKPITSDPMFCYTGSNANMDKDNSQNTEAQFTFKIILRCVRNNSLYFRKQHNHLKSKF